MMRSLTAISILLICISAQNPLDAQSYHTKSGKALKAYNEGLNAYDFIDFQKAELEFKEAISTDEGFYEAYMMLGELMSKQRRYSEASGFYRKAVRIDSLFFKPRLCKRPGSFQCLPGTVRDVGKEYACCEEECEEL